MIKIFALPGAGSSAIIYYKWMRYLPKSFAIIPLELPGRGMKIKEKKITENRELINYFFLEICKKISNPDDEYILVGNSFSSVLAMQLCNRLESEKSIKKPKHLFLSVEPPPNILRLREKMSEDITKMDFVKSVINRFFEDSIIACEKKNIILEWILENLYNNKQQFLELSVKNVCDSVFLVDEEIDKNTSELIRFVIEHLKLFLEDEDIIDNIDEKFFNVSTDITVFGAIDDKVASESDLKEWEKFTNGHFEVMMLEGEHTILYDNPDLVICKMKEVLEKKYE